MRDSLKILPLKASDQYDAARLLSNIFNVSSATAQTDVADGFQQDDPLHPVMLVIKAKGDIIGTVECFREGGSEESSCYGITKLAVDTEYRHQGIGTMLMAAAEEFISVKWLKGKEGEVSLYDGTKEHNPASLYYEGMGYTPWDPACFDSDGAPALSKPLNIPKPQQLKP